MQMQTPMLRVPAVMPALPMGPADDAVALRGLAVDRLTFRHLRTAREIDAVRPLRSFIDLSHAQAAPRYHDLEKKEMSLV